jgi:ribosomal protein S18 acetylase RimI-like enzyme
MAVRPLRRLQAPTESLYDRLAQHALHYAYTRPQIEALEREPTLLIEREGNLLGAIDQSGQIALVYSFESDRAFREHFPVMFDALLSVARSKLGLERVRFRLAYGPSRPVVEPVLKQLSFEPETPWLQFSLAKGAAPKVAAARGVTFRDGSLEDIDVIGSLDHEAFPDTPQPTSSIRHAMELGERAILAVAKGETIGMALYTHGEPHTAYLHTLAVKPAHRDRGIGSALTVRVAKRVFADGATQLHLRTTDDNAGAVRLYRRLGFEHIGAGRDYSRPVDAKVIEAMRKAKEGTFIKFGGWR